MSNEKFWYDSFGQEHGTKPVGKDLDTWSKERLPVSIYDLLEDYSGKTQLLRNELILLDLDNISNINPERKKTLEALIKATTDMQTISAKAWQEWHGEY